MTNEDSIFFSDRIKNKHESIRDKFYYHLQYSLIKDKTTLTAHDVYQALALTVRDNVIQKWLKTDYEHQKNENKVVNYLSMEFLIGRLMINSLNNLGIIQEVKEILKELNYSLGDIEGIEPDMGLGSGGLGRLAACFLDSMATHNYPAMGYGIRYEFGIFKQVIRQGYQVEEPDNWLRDGNPWEIKRPEIKYRVSFGGRVEYLTNEDGKNIYYWVDTEDIMGVAWDIPILGYETNNVNTLRLWQAQATDDFDFDYFNTGDYIKAVEKKNISENLSKVLYPNDNFHLGKVLRLKQEYFFVSATLQDIFAKFKADCNDFNKIPDQIAIQLNDTHPSLAIPELMRILIDQERLEWDQAWEITTKTIAYTNHTVLPEALEKWGYELLSQLLPRHLQIIQEINRRLLEKVDKAFPGDVYKMKAMSIIEGGENGCVRMANLCVEGSYSVNGVAKLHSEIVKTRIFKDFYDLYPEKFNNKTNGITQRRWLDACNHHLGNYISSLIGNGWKTDLYELKKLEQFSDNEEVLNQLREKKLHNKEILAREIYELTGIRVNPNSMFDVQVKRLHEYKRQLLNILHIIHLYNKIKSNPNANWTSRTIIFSGKAAPTYYIAKNIIKLITAVGVKINSDATINDLLKVVFIPNYSVSLAENIIPAADLSEQISTAGFEASGTGNMKFALNGALTLGTLDGANVEMQEEIGDENMFIFGLKAEEVVQMKKEGYSPEHYYQSNPDLKKVIDMLRSNYFNDHEPGIFQPILDTLLKNGDFFMVLEDFQAYCNMNERVSREFKDTKLWYNKVLLNIARCGKFSSDRAIHEYAKDIWNIKPVKV
ncbi:MAG: glycogen/starch/alpha-glucan phosphorylase [Candidatus Cloacimonadales bacterium]